MEFVENNISMTALRFIDTKQNINGVFPNAVDFIEPEQLLDSSLWAKFVEQFRERTVRRCTDRLALSLSEQDTVKSEF